jgi:uncharacterized protein YecE (DUF72 family)
MGSEPLPANLMVGTSSFSAEDWVGVFYPEGTRPEQYLASYAERYGTVEIDATFYRIPSAKQVAAWHARTPETFVFAAKVPQTVTHAESAEESLDDLKRFLEVMSGLEGKLGPLLFQFPYISKARHPEEYASGDRFRERLAALMEQVPAQIRFAVEVRNEKWIAAPLLDMLRARGAALAFIDFYTTPSMARLARNPENATADFAYVRFLGHHKQMDAIVEEKAQTGGRRWNEVVRDRTPEMQAWIPSLRDLSVRMTRIYAFFNNHYAGYAPGSIDLLRALWGGAGS